MTPRRRPSRTIFPALSQQRVRQIRHSIGGRLKLAREAAGFTQREAAKRLGLEHHGFVSKSETGRRASKAEDLVMFAELYRQHVAFFFEPFDEP
jgi:transcriptional regulator with XRE-family HTH domain